MQNEYIGIDTLDAYMRNGSIDHKLDLDTLHRMPTADVVPVVRCKDCKYHKPEVSNGQWGHCELYRVWTLVEHFCAKGARMDGGEQHAEL